MYLNKRSTALKGKLSEVALNEQKSDGFIKVSERTNVIAFTITTQNKHLKRAGMFFSRTGV